MKHCLSDHASENPSAVVQALSESPHAQKYERSKQLSNGVGLYSRWKLIRCADVPHLLCCHRLPQPRLKLLHMKSRAEWSCASCTDAAVACGQGSAESLLPAFDLLASLLLESGSEAREGPAMQAHAAIRAQLRESGHDSAAITRQLVRALRLMAAQLRLLQIDMSNSTLRMLAATLAGQEGIR